MAESLNENRLNQLRVAVLATDGVEQIELLEPVRALKQVGAQVSIVSPKSGSLQGWKHHDKGDEIPVDLSLDDADPAEFDALVLPGGALNPDQLRTNTDAVQFIRRIGEDGKPIASICHGPWTLIEADLVRGKRMTSWPSIKTDLKNAGAQWVDEEVIVDQGLVTSRKPDDIPAFNREMIRVFAESLSAARTNGAPASGRQKKSAKPSVAPSAQI